MAKKRKKSKKSEDEHGVKGVDDQLDELFEETWSDVEARSFDEVPDATYQTRLLAAVINNAQSSGRLQCSWEYLIIEGDQRGRHIFIHQGLDTEDGIAYFKGSLARLGHEEPTSKKELKATLEEAIEAPTYAAIRLSTKRKKIEGVLQEIQNKRIIKALDSDEVEDDFGEDELTPTMTASPSEEEPELGEEGEPTWEKGDLVKVKIDGEHYEGKIRKIKKNTADIKFDDGDEDTFPLDELESVTEEKAEEPEPESKPEEPPCKLVNSKFTPSDRRTLKKLAKENDFNPDDYDSSAELLCEVGDYCGLSGKFKSPAILIKAIQNAE